MTTTVVAETGAPHVTDTERSAWVVVVAGLALLGAAGFVNSYERVNQRMIPYFGDLAWTVPLSIDVGILIFTALDLLMAYRDIRSVWLRYVPRGLIAVTIYLNVVGETTWEGRISHAVLPGLWVIAVEVAGTAVRSIFGLRTTRAQLDRIRRSRWLLAPVSTARLRRRMVLREETSLTDARSRDLAFELAKADMRDRYGPVSWRWKAPRRERLLLRRGEVAPVNGTALALNPAPVPVPAETTPHRDRTNGRRPGSNRRPGTTALTETELIALAEQVADQMANGGVALTRRPFIERMRDAGHPIGTARAGALLTHLRHRATHANETDSPAEAAHADLTVAARS